MKSATIYDISGITISRLEQLAAKFVVDDVTGCWNWIGCLNKYGYGCVRNGKRSVKAHRLILAIVGQAKKANTVCDHLCRNPRCVNPNHLEEVTVKTNLERGVRHWSSRQKCKNGHDYNAKNTYIETRNGKTARVCRKCRVIRIAEHRQRIKLTTENY